MIDINSPTWKAIEAHLKARLVTLREKNDSEQLDLSATSKVRGQIAEVKELLALPNQLEKTNA